MRLPALFLAPLLLASSATPDTIYLVDGRSLDNVEIATETLKEITYREGSKRETVPSEKVLRVRYKTLPQLVDRAEVAAKEGQLVDAVADLETYLAGLASSGRRERLEWAPAYAAHRVVRLNLLLGEHAKAAAAADRLIQSFPQSRYVPAAYLGKAQAQLEQGNRAGAEKTLDDLIALVGRDSLSARWRLEAQLAKVLGNADLRGPQKREALIRISGEAGREFPTVRNKADVAEAEVLLAAKQPDDAEKIFNRVLADPQADGATLAAAYTGLGDVLYQRAATQQGEQAKGTFRQALLAYMRVVVNHPDQVAYVPKAMFYAGRSFDQIGAEDARDNSRKLYLAIVRQYPGTNWASEARGFLR